MDDCEKEYYKQQWAHVRNIHSSVTENDVFYVLSRMICYEDSNFLNYPYYALEVLESARIRGFKLKDKFDYIKNELVLFDAIDDEILRVIERGVISSNPSLANDVVTALRVFRFFNYKYTQDISLYVKQMLLVLVESKSYAQIAIVLSSFANFVKNNDTIETELLTIALNELSLLLVSVNHVMGTQLLNELRLKEIILQSNRLGSIVWSIGDSFQQYPVENDDLAVRLKLF